MAIGFAYPCFKGALWATFQSQGFNCGRWLYLSMFYGGPMGHFSVTELQLWPLALPIHVLWGPFGPILDQWASTVAIGFVYPCFKGALWATFQSQGFNCGRWLYLSMFYGGPISHFSVTELQLWPFDFTYPCFMGAL